MFMTQQETPASSRGLGVAVLVTLAGLALAGCTGNGVETAKPGAAVVKPTAAAAKPTVVAAQVAPGMAGAAKVGDCWATSPDLVNHTAWRGKAAVSCEDAHNAVTYFVGTLPYAPTYSKGGGGPSSFSLDKDTCITTAANAYLNHVGVNAVLRIGRATYAPTKAQWDAGSRWFRCDLGFPVDLQDPKRRLVWQPLPADIRAEVARDDMPYRICSNGSLQTRIRTDAARGKCGDGPRWLATKAVDLADKPWEPFPGAEAIDRQIRKACPLSSNREQATSPTRNEWSANLDKKYGWCWEWRTGPA
jgi:Septum formation